MTKSVVFIHGGNAFSSYDAFIEYLHTKEIREPYGISKEKRWKEDIFTTFGERCHTLFPSMPNSQNAHYTEWKLWFERYFNYIKGDAVLIGHSLGGYFLARYLSENTPSFTISALYLIASPFENDDFEGEDGGDFAFDPKNIENVEKACENIIIVHSEDDSLVPFLHAQKYAKALSNARTLFFKDRWHFIDSEFPELIEDIKKYI
jgi:uncharacterized protein